VIVPFLDDLESLETSAGGSARCSLQARLSDKSRARNGGPFPGD
jgi:hypothetical protein